MSIAMQNQIRELEGVIARAVRRIDQLEETVRGFTDPPVNIRIPPFPQILRRMGYTPPDDGSCETPNA